MNFVCTSSMPQSLEGIQRFCSQQMSLAMATFLDSSFILNSDLSPASSLTWRWWRF